MRDSALNRAHEAMIATAFVQLIRAYQAIIAPHFGKSCRFEPSCSRYTIAAIETHGALRGAALGFFRICRCNPFHAGGYDPVPGENHTQHPALQARTHHESSFLNGP